MRHPLENWPGEESILFLEGVQLIQLWLFRPLVDHLCVSVEVEGLLLVSLCLHVHLLPLELALPAHLGVEFSVAVAGVVVEGQDFLVPEVDLSERVRAVEFGNQLVDLLDCFLGDVVAAEDGVHGDELRH